MKYILFKQSRHPEIYEGIHYRCRIIKGDKLIAIKISNATDKLIVGEIYTACGNSQPTTMHKMYKASKFGKRPIVDGYIYLVEKSGLYSLHNFKKLNNN